MLLSPRHNPRARRCLAPTSPLPPVPSWRADAARSLARPALACAARDVSAPLALLRHPRDITSRALRCPSPRRLPRARRPAAPTSPLPPAPSRRVAAARLVASSAPARAARRLSAPLVRSHHHRGHPYVPCAAHHRAVARAHVGLLRRHRRSRLRRLGASTWLALSRARRWPVPRAELGALLARHPHPVTSPRVRCAANSTPLPGSRCLAPRTCSPTHHRSFRQKHPPTNVKGCDHTGS